MKKILITLMSMALFVSCGNSDNDTNIDDKQELSISATSILLNINGDVSAGSSNSITVTSTADWRLVGGDSWCNPSVNKGNNGTTVTFTATENNTGKDREVNLYFICGNATQKLTIKQLPESVVEFTKISDSYTVSLSGGRITIMVKTNLDIFNTEISEKWATIRADKDESQTKWVQFLFDANNTFYDRIVNITMFKGTDYEKTFSVTQPKFVGVILESSDSYEFGVAGGTITVTAAGNVGFSPIISEAGSGWINAEETSSTGTEIITKTFQITCSSGNWIRGGVVTFTPSSGESADINISQVNPNPELFDIPDPIFATALVSLKYMTPKDGRYYLNYSGYLATSIDLKTRDYVNLASVEGIKRLENITSFSVSRTNLRKIDLSENTSLNKISFRYTPLEELILGDINYTSLTITHFYSTDENTANSFTVSSNKLTSLTLNMTSSDISYLNQDKIEWIDITGCPILTKVSASRRGGNLKTVYVTKAQKDAYDSGTLTITNKYNTMDIVVR